LDLSWIKDDRDTISNIIGTLNSDKNCSINLGINFNVKIILDKVIIVYCKLNCIFFKIKFSLK